MTSSLCPCMSRGTDASQHLRLCRLPSRPLMPSPRLADQLSVPSTPWQLTPPNSTRQVLVPHLPCAELPQHVPHGRLCVALDVPHEGGHHAQAVLADQLAHQLDAPRVGGDLGVEGRAGRLPPTQQAQQINIVEAASRTQAVAPISLPCGNNHSCLGAALAHTQLRSLPGIYS